MKQALSAIKGAESSFGKLEKAIKKQFPSGAHSSPIYLSLKDQYTSFKAIVERSATAESPLKKNRDAYEKTFGGAFRGKDKITSDDEEFAETERLAGELESVLNGVQEDLDEVPHLETFLQQSLDRTAEVASLRKEMEKQVASVARIVERNRKSAQKSESEFRELAAWLKGYPIFEEGDSVRAALASMQTEYDSDKSALENILKQLNYFLSGRASSGEGESVWELFDALSGKRGELLKILDETPPRLEAQREKLEAFTGRAEDFREEVSDYRGDLEKDLRSIGRQLERSRQAAEKVAARFEDVSIGIESYPLFAKGDSARSQLMDAASNYGAERDSLEAALALLDRFLGGQTRPKGRATARETFDNFRGERDKLTALLEETPPALEEQREKLEDLVGLIAEFKEVLEDMERDIASLDASIREEAEGLAEDSLRTVSLMSRRPKNYSENDFPYLELKSSYSDISVRLAASREALGDLRKAREDLISHVVTMDGVKTDAVKYNHFKELQRDFGEANNRGVERLKELDDAIEANRQVILGNFLNTPEYWSLTYEVRSEPSQSGEVVEENFGYLIDLNRFPAQKYHGNLISDFQLRLLKRGRTNPAFEFVFSGIYGFPIGGFKMVTSGGAVLLEAHRDSVTSKTEESGEDGRLTFEWNVPVSLAHVSRIVGDPAASLLIQFVTISGRVNLTGYSSKMFRAYKIPETRLENWRQMAGLAEPVS